MTESAGIAQIATGPCNAVARTSRCDVGPSGRVAPTNSVQGLLRRAAIVLIAVGTCQIVAQEPPKQVADILKTTEPWKVIQQLNEWNRPLSKADVVALESLVADPTRADSLQRYAARRLWRRHDPAGHPVSPSAARAEEILYSVRGGKVGDTSYNKQIESLIAMGNEAVPVLLEPLHDNVEYSSFPGGSGFDGYIWRQFVAVSALGGLSDPSIVPALKRFIQKNKNRQYGPAKHARLAMTFLLKKEPTQPMIDFVTEELLAIRDPYLQESAISTLAGAE